jgi:hypothetical protein
LAGTAECLEYGWHVKVTWFGLVRCDKDDPQAFPDVRRLLAEAVWNPQKRRFVRKKGG